MITVLIIFHCSTSNFIFNYDQNYNNILNNRVFIIASIPLVIKNLVQVSTFLTLKAKYHSEKTFCYFYPRITNST